MRNILFAKLSNESIYNLAYSTWNIVDSTISKQFNNFDITE